MFQYSRQPSSVDLALKLVAEAYAVLSHYVAPRDSKGEFACIFFPTDPVCARLAMALMDQDWAISGDGKEMRGASKLFWTRTMTEMFTSGLCHPSHGGVGEVAAAAYLLFCGDVLRKDLDATYKTFSVPLSTYIQCLLQPADFYKPNMALGLERDGGRQDKEGTPQIAAEARVQRPQIGPPYSDAHVSFIQVTRNYIRFSVDDVFDQCFLQGLYLSGTAFYTNPLFHMFDLVASIKLSNRNSHSDVSFVPLLVSVSTKFDIATQRDALEAIKSILQRNQKKHGLGGMGLRLLLNQTKSDNDKPVDLLDPGDVTCLLDGVVVSKVVVVPHDDPFGITNMLSNVTFLGSTISEIQASHSFMYHHSLEQLASERLVHAGDVKNAHYLNEIREELLASRTKDSNAQIDSHGEHEA